MPFGLRKLSLLIYNHKTKHKMKVTLNEDQIKMLEAWANELPTKYGMTFIQFLAQQVQEQNPKEEEKAE